MGYGSTTVSVYTIHFLVHSFTAGPVRGNLSFYSVGAGYGISFPIIVAGHSFVATSCVSSSYTGVITYRYSFVISIDPTSSVRIVLVRPSNFGVSPSIVVSVRSIVRISDRAVVSSIW